MRARELQRPQSLYFLGISRLSVEILNTCVHVHSVAQMNRNGDAATLVTRLRQRARAHDNRLNSSSFEVFAFVGASGLYLCHS